MITFMICLFLLSLLFGLAWKLTGALFKACLWLFILLPVGLLLWGIGMVCCCTILLIPLGIGLFKVGTQVMFQW